MSRTIPPPDLPPYAVRAGLDPALLARVETLCDQGSDRWERFDREIRQHRFHPFVAADYRVVLDELVTLFRPGLRFLEWGSATGVITILADCLGFEAFGIELDEHLVQEARELARVEGSGARFAAGSFLPTGYHWRQQSGDNRLGTIGHGPSGYLELGVALDDVDVVFAYPWKGEEPLMLDLMRAYGRPDALLLLYAEHEIKRYRGGRARL